MNWQAGSITNRLIPILALLLLETPLSWIGGICHEGGHGLVALAQGGTFTGILLTQSGSYALASSYLVWVGGWMGQYALAAAALLLYWKVKPRSFLGRTILAVLVVQNLIDEPPYIASLQGDSAFALKVLEATGIGRLPSVGILETAALVLGVIGIYGAWRTFRSYLSGVFNWIGGRRGTWASLLFVVGSAVFSWSSNLGLSESVLTTSILLQVASFIAFLLVFSLLVVPQAPVGVPRTTGGGPTVAALAFIVLLFVEAELASFFVLPITIPFP